jgi:DNA-binding MarR family transcriptional regulator
MIKASRSKQEITTEFTREITKVNLALKQYIQAKFRQHDIDLTFEMLQVMACLWKNDGINQQEVSNITVKDKASMTYLIDNLTTRKLVYRLEDDKDRRNKLIFLTEKGKHMEEQIQPWITEMYAVVNKSITAEQLSACIKVLGIMSENLRKNSV